MSNTFWEEGTAYWHSHKQNWDETPAEEKGLRNTQSQYINMKGQNPTAFDIISDKSSPCLTLEDTKISLVHLTDLTVDCE